MSTKWLLFLGFLWLGVAFLSAIMEYTWIEDTEASTLAGLFNGVNITSYVGLALGGATIVTGAIAAIAGNRAFTAVSAMFFVGFALSFWKIATFDYPSLFYGPYEIVRWIFALLGGFIFISIIATFLRGGSSS